VTRVFDAIQLVREMVKQDVTPQAIIGPGSPGAFEKEFTDALGIYGDYYMVSTPWYDPSSTMTKSVLAEFNKANPNHRFELNVGFAYEAAMITADAYKRANSTQSAALHEALRATDISSHLMAGGPIKFNEKGHNPNIGSVLLQNLNRRPQVVMPSQIAEAKPVFPMPKWRGRT
jgi:branched-chain amino acid transport system substrate-binding protein